MAEHLITPPPELVSEWTRNRGYSCSSELWDYIATQAARWGADQELEACCEWLRKDDDAYQLVGLRAVYLDHELHAARRPKPPSLKEQALMALEDGDIGPGASLTPVEVCIIRRALEQLDG